VCVCVRVMRALLLHACVRAEMLRLLLCRQARIRQRDFCMHACLRACRDDPTVIM
jgi:hypothetical protein